jgi:hypothetical protein
MYKASSDSAKDAAEARVRSVAATVAAGALAADELRALTRPPDRRVPVTCTSRLAGGCIPSARRHFERRDLASGMHKRRQTGRRLNQVTAELLALEWRRRESNPCSKTQQARISRGTSLPRERPPPSANRKSVRYWAMRSNARRWSSRVFANDPRSGWSGWRSGRFAPELPRP